MEFIKESFSKGKRSFFRETLLCMAIGAVLRIAYILAFPVQPRDAYAYKEIILAWEKTDKLDQIAFVPFSLWILKAPFHFFHADLFHGGIVINMVLGLLIIAIAVMIAGKHFNSGLVVLITGLMAATHPGLVRYSCSFLRENTYLFFLLLAFLFLDRFISDTGVLNIVMASVFSSFAFLCRLEGIEMIVISCLALFFLVVFRRIGLRKAIRAELLFVFIFIAIYFIICECLHFDGLRTRDVALKIELIGRLF